MGACFIILSVRYRARSSVLEGGGLESWNGGMFEALVIRLCICVQRVHFRGGFRDSSNPVRKYL